MTQRINISRMRAGQTMTVPHMRALLEQIYQAVNNDIELGDAAPHVRRAIKEIDCVRAVAIQVASEADADSGSPGPVTH